MPADSMETRRTWLPGAALDGTARLRAFCFPPAGSGAGAFRVVRKAIASAGLEICPVQLPGRENRFAEPFATDLVDLAGRAATVLLPYLDVPFVIVGHSMGAIVGYEVARAIEDRYRLSPDLFIAACARTPDRVYTGITKIADCPDEELLARLAERIGRVLLAELGDNLEYRKVFVETLRADLALIESYTVALPRRLGCSVAAVGATDDPGVSAADIARWGSFGTGDFRHETWPGDHFCVLSDPVRLQKLIDGHRPNTGEE